MPQPGPLLVILSGPSGVGKDAVLSRMKDQGYPFHYVVTVTTRPKRPTERDGVDYHFLSPERFQEMLRKDELLEWAQVYGHFYGVPREQVSSALKKGMDVMIKTDVQGAATIKGLLPEAILIFIAPPTMEELFRRLWERKTESPEALKRRVETAQEEMGRLPLFDYVVENVEDKIDQAVAQIGAIITAEKCRTKPRSVQL